MPVFPTASPLLTSVGGTDWGNFFQSPSNEPEHGMEAVEGLAGSSKNPHKNWAVNRYLKKMNSVPAFLHKILITQWAGGIQIFLL